MQMTFFDGNDNVRGMPSFTSITNNTKDYPEKIIKPGDEETLESTREFKKEDLKEATDIIVEIRQ